jgi:hypothetical protein
MGPPCNCPALGYKRSGRTNSTRRTNCTRGTNSTHTYWQREQRTPQSSTKTQQYNSFRPWTYGITLLRPEPCKSSRPPYSLIASNQETKAPSNKRTTMVLLQWRHRWKCRKTTSTHSSRVMLTRSSKDDNLWSRFTVCRSLLGVIACVP